MPAMRGMTLTGGTARSLFSVVASGLPMWTVMSVAMMGPGALAGVRHTGLNSLRWRRGRAMVEFASAYLLVWVMFGIVVLTFASVRETHTWIIIGLALDIAACWQFSVFKRRWLRDCHRSRPLPLWGWAAEMGALRFGFLSGLACLGSCWCLMVVMAFVPTDVLLWTVALTAIVTAEKLSQRPRRTTRLAGGALAVAAVAAFLV
jgi:predicted metal-binding membrane protein